MVNIFFKPKIVLYSIVHECERIGGGGGNDNYVYF